ncbi:hypothetical protein Taro_043828 [Colocasia esculenta]|uniref:Ubiquitin-like domain-containing protein n=1 Tax=Colocasia esculenta TaxID=4460 RepID=A0A843WWR1_COLES|nr:hypothetical protein [Colocasia esculenta]
MEEEVEEEGRAIEVRSLDGTSTVVRISPDRTVGDLKVLLKESFPPAKKTPDFRLFYKGDRLSVGSRLGDHQIDHGGFVVLVPFAKRARTCRPPESSCGGGAKPLGRSDQFEDSKHADAAWLDIMEDLRSMPRTADDVSSISNTVALSANASNRKPNVPTNRGAGKSSMEMKSGQRESDTRFLRDILRKGTGVLRVESSCQSSSQALGLATCLSDPQTGNCVFSDDSCGNSEEAGQCMCPAWLKRLVKCFSFLNVAHGFLLMQHKCMEWACLKEALGQPGDSKTEDIDILDVEHLMALFPKVSFLLIMVVQISYVCFLFLLFAL